MNKALLELHNAYGKHLAPAAGKLYLWPSTPGSKEPTYVYQCSCGTWMYYCGDYCKPLWDHHIYQVINKYPELYESLRAYYTRYVDDQLADHGLWAREIKGHIRADIKLAARKAIRSPRHEQRPTPAA